MKILMVNKFYYIKGGSETYYFNLKKLLEKNGHKVIDFAMNDEKNFDSNYKQYFVSKVDYNIKMSFFKNFKVGIRLIYNREAKKNFEKLIKDTKPDIIHLNIFQHQISSSIINVAKKYHIPIIYTAHDLQALCPNYKMMDNNFKICELCKNNNYFSCVKKKCIKNSYLKSFIGYLDAKYNQINKTYDKISYIITPSEFYKNKFIEFGYNSNKIIHLPNFINFDKKISKNENIDNYFLYFGRISEEKGILTLIEAVKIADINLKIVGTGPLIDVVKNKIISEKINNIELLGFKSGDELYKILAYSKCVIIPSEWYENGPYAGIESLAMSKPLIGSDLGGIPELIDDGKNGYIFKHGNAKDLAQKISKINNLDISKLKNFQKHSYNIYQERYLENQYYEKLINIYNFLLSSNQESSKSL